MTIQRTREIVVALSLALVLAGCSTSSTPRRVEIKAKPVLAPEPVVNHSPKDAQPGEKIEHGELILAVDNAKKELNAQHHSYKVLEARRRRLSIYLSRDLTLLALILPSESVPD